MNFANIGNEARAIHDSLVKWRRALHQIPETELATVETSKYICAQLDEMGIKYKTNVGGADCYSVVALVEGKRSGKCFALRCDIDGLPMIEETGLPFAAKNGNMHACAHDAHAAIGLGVAKILLAHLDELCGSVKILFQPAEEGCKQGPGGAKRMLDDGALENPKVDAIIALHAGNVWVNNVKPGDIGIRYTSFAACMDRFSIVVKGKGSHGAMPEGSIDPITISAQVVNAVQTIVSREVDPQSPAVISICEIHGGSAFNIIPGEVKLQGTVRALSSDVRKFLSDRIGQVAKGVAEGMRGSVEYFFSWDGPVPLVNNEEFTREFEKVAGEVIGAEHVKEMPRPAMGGDDAAFFLEKVPGTYFYLPTYDENQDVVYPHHNTKFTTDEKHFWIGSAVMSAMALHWLEKHK